MTDVTELVLELLLFPPLPNKVSLITGAFISGFVPDEEVEEFVAEAPPREPVPTTVGGVAPEFAFIGVVIVVVVAEAVTTVKEVDPEASIINEPSITLLKSCSVVEKSGSSSAWMCCTLTSLMW